jgi:hypothetical protein
LPAQRLWLNGVVDRDRFDVKPDPITAFYSVADQDPGPTVKLGQVNTLIIINKFKTAAKLLKRFKAFPKKHQRYQQQIGPPIT